jgi:hypothetical protein
MSILTINVDSIDRTDKIDPMSFQLSRALTNQADTLVFVVPRTQSGDWKPLLLEDVEIIDGDSTTIFAGSIVTIEEVMDGGIEYVKCQCRDWTFEMDRKLVVKSYSNQTVAEIIEDIVDSYIGELGFTDTNVVCDVEIDYIAFNYEYPSKVLQQLATLVNYDWYVDPNKDIHFFAKDASTAPFSLSDDNETYYIDSLQVKKDATKIKNTITVRGGQYLGDSFTETYVADGEQLTFPLVNKYSGITVEVEGVPVTVGISNIDSLNDYDCLYNFQEKSLTFKPFTKPAVGDLLEVTGSPYVPVLSKRSDGASIGTYGVFEYKIVDSTINTKIGARERALAELNLYSDALDEGSFDTSLNGLETGQLITVESALRNISENFVITRISTTIKNPDQLNHKVTITTTQTFGMVEFLQQLLIQKDKEIQISADEVLDELVSISDTLSITDSVSTPTTNEPPYHYVGGANVARWGFATWS